MTRIKHVERTKLLFIGECRSLTAIRNKWTWEDGRLAAKPLFEALLAMGVDPKLHTYTNLWLDTSPPCIANNKWAWLGRMRDDGHVLVALGKKVSDKLTEHGVDHVALVHPAARGKIRKRERYHAHVEQKLRPVVEKLRHALEPRQMFVRSADADTSTTCYIFEVATKRGRRRVYPPGIGKHDEAATAHSDDLRRWFTTLGITRVTSTFGESETSPECIKDGNYTVSAYLRWWRRAEREESK